MKLIKPFWQIIEPTGYTIDDIYKSIELAGRVSHKSEDKITEDSAKTFVDRMLNMKHLATCEFGTVYLYIDYNSPDFGKVIDRYIHNKYSKCNYYPTIPNRAYISSNYRVLVENNWLDDLQYLCKPTEYHYKRYTVKYICDRGILAEFTRHRTFSFMAESSRYCNYSKNKFGNELTYICPCWLDYDKVQELVKIANKDNKEIYKMGHDESLSMEYRGLCSFIYDMSNHEHGYLFQISSGWKPEQARAVLPLSLKTELYMCGFAEDWKKFFELRSKKYGIGNPHPQSDELATPLYEEFIKRGYIDG